MDRDWSLFRRLSFYFYPYRYLLLVAIMCVILAKVIESTVPLYLATKTDTILQEPFTSSFLWHFYLIVLGLLISGYIIEAIGVTIKISVGQKALHALRTDVYTHIMHLPLRYYDQTTVGHLITRTVHDVTQMNRMFAESLVPMIGNLFLFIAILVGVAILDYRLICIMLIILPLACFLTNRFRNNQRSFYEEIRSILGMMNGFIQEHLMGAAVIRSFGLHEKEKKQFEQMNVNYCVAYKKTVDEFAFFFAALEFLRSFSLISVFAFLTISAVGLHLESGTFFAFNLYIMMIFRPLMDLAERYNILQSSFAAASRVFQLLDESVESTVDQGTITLASVEQIEFQDVWFSYDGKFWIYQGLSFVVNKRESLAIVGETGAGKTSIMNLLLRFYDIQKGSIAINGIDIRKYTLASLRNQFSLVLQDPVLFSGTIRENITLFDPNITQEHIESTLHAMGVEDVFYRLMGGLERPLLERGKSLSAGERQLIVMARALTCRRSVLLFDEATANIDSFTEAMIQRALKVLLKSTTSIVVAHRLTTIHDADRILVLCEGVLIEEGSHEELMAKGGTYQKLYVLGTV